MEIIKLKLSELKPYNKNAKIHTKEQIEQIKKSIEQFGMNDPIGIWRDNTIIEGHGRYQALLELGYDEIDCIRLDHLTDEERKAYTLAHNKINMNTDFDLDILDLELDGIQTIDMSDFGFELKLDDIEIEAKEKEEYGSLQDEYIIPPFSVFDTKQGYWQDRKRKWLGIGIKSELGRDDELTFKFTGFIKEEKQPVGVSIFDPVLCEICYKWFNIDGGKIYDPFAGGSVRGIVASKLGYDYTGIDLREEQIEANKKNAQELGVKPTWYCDDSNNVDKYIEDNSVDMIFSCPPYADLEVYSDKENDLSNMEYDDFKAAYKSIITKACKKLKHNRFAVFVVGDVRDKNGNYRNFVDYTKECFNENGCQTYNEVILLNTIGTAPVRCKRAFNSGRKLTKVHQNVLIFYKGDTKEIKNIYKELNLEDIDFGEEE